MILEITALILSSLSLVGVIALLFITLKKSKTIETKNDDEIKMKINVLSETIPLNISNSVKNEMLALSTNLSDQSEKNNAKLERFQANITESLDKKFDSLNSNVNTQLSEINKRVEDKLAEGFEKTNKTFGNVQERLTKIDEAQRNIEALSGEVVSLKNVLENNQTRGQYGEFQLKLILNNVFGDAVNLYAEQYVIKKGKDDTSDVRPDAVVFLPPPNLLICIDSKFPFQDYNKLFSVNVEKTDKEIDDLKKSFRTTVKSHIYTVRDKYIIPNKTAPQALMFIPNDGVFAYIHVELSDLVMEAQRNNVIITSPATLQSILVTLNMLRINYERNKNIDKITKQLSLLGKDFEMFNGEWSKLSRTIDTISGDKTKLDKRFEKLGGRFSNITQSSGIETKEEEIEEIEKKL